MCLYQLLGFTEGVEASNLKEINLFEDVLKINGYHMLILSHNGDRIWDHPESIYC